MEESDLEDLDRFRGHERKGGRCLGGGERVKRGGKFLLRPVCQSPLSSSPLGML